MEPSDSPEPDLDSAGVYLDLSPEDLNYGGLSRVRPEARPHGGAARAGEGSALEDRSVVASEASATPGAEMSESQPSASPTAEAAARSPAKLGKPGPHEIILALLAILSLVGVAIANFSARSGFYYWLFMVPVFGGASIYAGWTQARQRQEGIGSVLRKQLLHWSVLPFAVYLIYMLEETGRLNREDAGLVALIVLSLTSFLAGVHFDWRLAILGALLGVGAAFVALASEFFWIFFVLGLLVVAFLVFWRKRGG